MKKSAQPSGKEIADFFAGEAVAEALLPSLKVKIQAIQTNGKTAWVGVGPCNAWIGSSDVGASSPYLSDTRSVPYFTPRENPGKTSIAFQNGFWCGLSKELQIKPSRYMFREVM
jgi:hypothetical protein